MKKELIAQRDPKSPISEVFRTLRTNIQFMNSGKKLRVIQVASTFPGEGKSYVSSNLAVTFAQAGKRVIIIDADMRKGRLYSIFGASPRPGLSNYLSGMDADENGNSDISRYIQRTEVDNLLLISAGNIPPNPSELLVSEQMRNLLEELKEVCDIVIIDGTPCALVADSVILSRIVDTTVIVTACKETKKDNLDKIVKNIKQVGGNIAGIVLNKVPISAKKYSENYYYGSTSMSNMQKSKARMKESTKNAELLKRRTTRSVAQNLGQNTAKPVSIETQIETNKDADDLPKPNFGQNTNSENNSASVETANDILKKVNSYLEQEKKNLN